MPLDSDYNKRVKNNFGFLGELTGAFAGGVLGSLVGQPIAGAQEGFVLGNQMIDKIWTDPESWQGKKFGSAPFRVTGSKPGPGNIIGSGSRVTGSAPMAPPIKFKPVQPPVKSVVRKYHHRWIKTRKYFRKRFY